MSAHTHTDFPPIRGQGWRARGEASKETHSPGWRTHPFVSPGGAQLRPRRIWNGEGDVSGRGSVGANLRRDLGLKGHTRRRPRDLLDTEFQAGIFARKKAAPARFVPAESRRARIPKKSFSLSPVYTFASRLMVDLAKEALPHLDLDLRRKDEGGSLNEETEVMSGAQMSCPEARMRFRDKGSKSNWPRRTRRGGEARKPSYNTRR